MENDEKKHKINPDIFKNIKEITPEMEELIDKFINDVGETAEKILKTIEEITPPAKDDSN
jgi:predicted nuclease of restriction endonuclease-like RecB superfamily